MMEKQAYYLGFDLSTQQLKCLAINQDLKIIHSETVEFEKELPHYNTKKGVYLHEDEVASPVFMWLEAIDLVFMKYVNSGFNLGKVKAISGSAQQHGSVYWTTEADFLLQSLSDNHDKSLLSVLAPNAFSWELSPNWQDHSTGSQCTEFEKKVGGPKQLASLTGSKAHYRFTGPQIMKFVGKNPEGYERTKTISLVSNFLSSILCGKLVPLEEADACGMNLYDIKEHKFDEGCLSLIDKDTNNIRRKLMDPPTRCPEPICLGNISQYFVKKYGFQSNCSIYPITGDNLATICSLPLKTNDILVSLGTSTTVLLVTDHYNPSPNYHLFIHPTIANNFMGMICYCNGSLAREEIRDELNKSAGLTNSSWDLFDKAVLADDIHTDNELGLYFPLGEIVPSTKATYKRIELDPKTKLISKIVPKFQDIRHDAKNIVESQALSCRIRIYPLLSSDAEHSRETSDNIHTKVKFDGSELPLSEYLNKRPNRAFFVGGASKNDSIVRKFAQVIGAKEANYRLDTPNSCALGGCFKAIWSHLVVTGRIDDPFSVYLEAHFLWDELDRFYEPDQEAWEMYNKKIEAMSNLEALL
ncbi:xylulokinase NDAI_0D02190 [Naumovozyma dairenensis CBS 421]|uniref:Xylulose kinase n=1 Tax=Naumovozyma dairenensis (strain ATCC 10597 / BCRC 20456 / CBS 421 / NBRC 0211 / NRRL Y-12639) TaxID=1071378 RepID=G0W9S2_NAUDC|nr:hypothetical protein NDAI_0D02190 [Naumovozyma dairenensis CBS 421]CCD24533.1 hypothetical protein NDAI_0D02190 [Naumovozyma dairenensis CBS 421]